MSQLDTSEELKPKIFENHDEGKTFVRSDSKSEQPTRTILKTALQHQWKIFQDGKQV